jgi:hypothetical protein
MMQQALDTLPSSSAKFSHPILCLVTVFVSFNMVPISNGLDANDWHLNQNRKPSLFQV